MPGSQRPASRRPLVVAVDGPSGSGKSTVSRLVAARLGLEYLDTGAMYRAVTWAVLQAGIDPGDAEAVAKVAADAQISSGTDPEHPTIRLDGVAVDEEIRSPEVTGVVSAVGVSGVADPEQHEWASRAACPVRWFGA